MRYREVMPAYEEPDIINRLATSDFKELVRDSSNQTGSHDRQDSGDVTDSQASQAD